MTPEQFQREKTYQATISIARSMLKQGIITERDFKKVNRMMIQKYRPLIGGLCS
jgi:hypothetical protein